MNRDDGSRPYARALVLLVAAVIVVSGCITAQNSSEPEAAPSSDTIERNGTPEEGDQGSQDRDPPPSEEGRTDNRTVESNTTVSRSEYSGAVTWSSFLAYRCDIVEATDNTAGACFQLPNGTLNLTLEIDDDTSPSVGAYWYLVNASDGERHSGRFCDSTTVSLSPASNGSQITADAVLVDVKGPYKGNLICVLEDGGAHAATGGTITATIRYLPPIGG